MKQKLFIVFCALLFVSNHCFAQNRNEISVYTGFLQIKDRFNQGMVYNGTQIGFRYGRNWHFENWELRYRPEIAFGVSLNRQMVGVNINFVPIDFTGLVPIFNNGQHNVKAGLGFATNYNYQIYPNQHNSARLFWHSDIGFALCAEYSFQWQQRRITVFFQNSVAGFVSRTESVSHYFYSFGLAYFFTQPHTNMQFGSFDKFNRTNASVEFDPNTTSGHSFVLGIEYISSHFGNRFQSLNYNLKWKRRF